jgi:hypothetical protein
VTGNPVSLVSGPGADQSEATSGAVTANILGVWCFRATYAPDSAVFTGSSGDDNRECFTVRQHPTTLVTDPQSPSGTNITSVNLGASVVDHAVVTDSDAGGGSPTGSVNFYICNPNQVTGTGANAHCAGTGSTGDGTAVTGNPVALNTAFGVDKSDATSGAVTANILGVWCFRATYTPATDLFGGSSGDDNRECFSVGSSSSGTSAQKWLPNDHVVVSTPTGSLPGTLSITLRRGACDGNVVYTEPVPNSGAFTATAAGASYDTTNGSVPATTFVVNTGNQDTYFWRIIFTPDSAFATGFTKCENSVVTVND